MNDSTENKELLRFHKYGNLHPATCILIDFLRDKPVGALVTTEEIAEVIGAKEPASPGNETYRRWDSAKKYLRRAEDIVWEWQRGASAVKRLDDTEILDMLGPKVDHIRRSTRTGQQLVKAINSDNVDGRKREMMARIVQLGGLQAFSKTSTLKKLEARDISKPPDMRKLLEAMKESTEETES